MTFTIHVENFSVLLLMGILGIVTIILIFSHLVKSEKTINPFTLISKFFNLIFKTEIKTDTGRINLFFGLCAFLYVMLITFFSSPINDLIPSSKPITSELLYFMIVAVIVLVCVYMVSKHESIVSGDKIKKDQVGVEN